MAGATDLQREQMLGNTMHVAAVVGLLEDLKEKMPGPTDGKEAGTSKKLLSPENESLQRAEQHQIVSVDTSNVVQAMWDSLHENPFSSISDDPIEVVDEKSPHMQGPWPDVPHPPQQDACPSTMWPRPKMRWSICLHGNI